MSKETIPIGPQSWREAAQLIALVLENGTDQGRREARAHLGQMARVADLVPELVAFIQSVTHNDRGNPHYRQAMEILSKLELKK